MDQRELTQEIIRGIKVNFGPKTLEENVKTTLFRAALGLGVEKEIIQETYEKVQREGVLPYRERIESQIEQTEKILNELKWIAQYLSPYEEES